jgi:L-lactate dehydrogenase complex protein LldG
MQTYLKLFQEKAQAASAEVHCCTSKHEALIAILQFLRDENIADCPGSYAVWADDEFRRDLDCEALAAEIPGLHFKVTKELAAQAKVGISQFDWAIADTGTLVVDSSAVDQRLVSSLPPIHVALIQRSKLLPNLATTIGKIGSAHVGYLSMITGPSRTADIERVLTIGVHGPSRLVIFFFDDAEGGAQ